MKITAYAKSVVGDRKENQDSYLIDEKLHLYAVADGVGGGSNGDVASKMAVEGLQAAVADGKTVREAIDILQAAVVKEAMDTLGEPIMGTTLTAVQISGRSAKIFHVGDSRCYHITAGHMLQMTKDHEIYDERFQGPVLASYLGMPPELEPVTVQEEQINLLSGEKLLLCSDGLYKQVEENEVLAVIKEHGHDPQMVLEELCSRAEKADYSDNVTIVYIESTATPDVTPPAAPEGNLDE